MGGPVVEGYPDDNPKTIHGVAKPQLDKIPPTALIHMGVVMGLGAKKYGPFNWRDKTVSSSVYIGAALRHLTEYLDGSNSDDESGASPLAHVMSCCAILIDAQEFGNLNDDRPKPGPSSEMIRFFNKEGHLDRPERTGSESTRSE